MGAVHTGVIGGILGSAMLHRSARLFGPTAAAALLALLLWHGVVAAEVPAPTVPPDVERALVLDVIDGDTIRVDRDGGGSERVRYIGIDTPEIAHRPEERDEPWGRQATEANEDLVDGRLVLLERDVSETDRYDRLLRYVWVETTHGWVMVNGALVADGLAESRAYEPDTRHHVWLERSEAAARTAGRGLHGDEPEVISDDGAGLLEDIIEFFLGG